MGENTAEFEDSSVVRTIHHMACSGGTIMCKALAAQPHVVLLSEISPVLHGGMPFVPFDPERQFLVNYVRRRRVIPKGRSLEKMTRHILAQRVRSILDICREEGLILVVRDHAHSDFARNLKRRQSMLLLALTEAGIPTRSIATLRDPIDAWASIKENGWEFRLDGFDHFCSRLMDLLARFPEERIFRYEYFCRAPDQVTSEMCRALGLPFDPTYRERLADYTLTGDSGRSDSTEISTRPRRELQQATQAEIAVSEIYRTFKATHYGRPMPQ